MATGFPDHDVLDDKSSVRPTGLKRWDLRDEMFRRCDELGRRGRLNMGMEIEYSRAIGLSLLSRPMLTMPDSIRE